MNPVEWLCNIVILCHIGGCLVACNGHVTSYEALAVPLAPTNVSLAQILATAAFIRWEADVRDHITRFQLTVLPITEPQTDPTSPFSSPGDFTAPQKIVADVDGSKRRHHLRELTPETVYEVFIMAFNTEGRSNDSDVISFKTLSVADGTEIHKIIVNPGEITVVMFVLCAWFCAIALFLHKWGKIRITHTSEPRYKHAPKNLDTIKVVKKPSDSVIYKTHPKDSLYSRTMDARMKRIERMNTMPNIKVDTAKEKEKEKAREVLKPDPESRKFERNNTDPMIEMDTVFSKEKEKRRKDMFRPPPPVVEVEESTSASNMTAASVV